jgi:glyoxylase-like metal-dependent hydrolase (beta-lactamase superfamily II)
MEFDTELSYGSDYKTFPLTSVMSGDETMAAPDLCCFTVQIVNLCFIGLPKREGWVLVDAGMPGSAPQIIKAAEKRFGPGRPPLGIVLTHGHFDHVGAVLELIKHWKVPVYAHQLEFPYLTGKEAYPSPDFTVNGGLVAKMSFLFPVQPIHLGSNLRPLPENGEIPILPGWRWVHTPGHTPGHISLFRERDRALIAGDAFVTVKQESLYKVITQDQEISGPPKYLTTDWEAARASVKTLYRLNPSIAVTGHGKPMGGEVLSASLRELLEKFDQIAMPSHGKYVH